MWKTARLLSITKAEKPSDRRLAAQRIEGLLQTLMQTGKNRRIAQGIAAALGFPKRHHQIEKIFWFIGFEGDYPFLIVQTERIRGVELDRGKAMADFNVFV